MAAAGDVNGDGYADVIVGAPWYDAGGTDEGRAYVYHGGPAAGRGRGLDADGDRRTPTSACGGTAGDVNGDGSRPTSSSGRP